MGGKTNVFPAYTTNEFAVGNPVAALLTAARSLFTETYHHTDYIERSTTEENTAGKLKHKELMRLI